MVRREGDSQQALAQGLGHEQGPVGIGRRGSRTVGLQGCIALSMQGSASLDHFSDDAFD